jgi:hypothetical protein
MMQDMGCLRTDSHSNTPYYRRFHHMSQRMGMLFGLTIANLGVKADASDYLYRAGRDGRGNR